MSVVLSGFGSKAAREYPLAYYYNRTQPRPSPALISPATNNLLQLRTSIIAPELCRAVLSPPGMPAITDQMICAAPRGGTETHRHMIVKRMNNLMATWHKELGMNKIFSFFHEPCYWIPIYSLNWTYRFWKFLSRGLWRTIGVPGSQRPMDCGGGHQLGQRLRQSWFSYGTVIYRDDSII